MAPVWQLYDEESPPKPLPKPHQRKATTPQRMVRSRDLD